MSVAVVAISLFWCHALWWGPEVTCHKLVASNVGLTPSVQDLTEGAELVVQGYTSLSADVVCAQEFWQEKFMAQTLVATTASFPYHYSGIHYDMSQLQDPNDSNWYFWRKRGACKPSETVYLTTILGICAGVNSCFKAPDISSVAVCLASNCANVLRSQLVSQECLGCLLQNLAASVTHSLVNCHASSIGHRFNPSGLMVLSRLPILTAKYVPLHPDSKLMIERGYIEAQIQDAGTIICTHLSSNLSAFYEYDVPFTNYHDQQRHEIQTINKTYHDMDHFLIGDLNTGPKVFDEVDPERNLTAEFEDNYDMLLNSGYKSPYMDLDGRCTYCTDNPLVDDKYPNYVLDHVMYKGEQYSVDSVARILTASDPRPMSDHYGVMVDVRQN